MIVTDKATTQKVSSDHTKEPEAQKTPLGTEKSEQKDNKTESPSQNAAQRQTDAGQNMDFVCDTGANPSVVTLDTHLENTTPTDLRLTSVNGTPISTNSQGELHATATTDTGKQVPVVIEAVKADVNKNILGTSAILNSQVFEELRITSRRKSSKKQLTGSHLKTKQGDIIPINFEKGRPTITLKRATSPRKQARLENNTSDNTHTCETTTTVNKSDTESDSEYAKEKLEQYQETHTPSETTTEVNKTLIHSTVPKTKGKEPMKITNDQQVQLYSSLYNIPGMGHTNGSHTAHKLNKRVMQHGLIEPPRIAQTDANNNREASTSKTQQEQCNVFTKQHPELTVNEVHHMFGHPGKRLTLRIAKHLGVKDRKWEKCEQCIVHNTNTKPHNKSIAQGKSPNDIVYMDLKHWQTNRSEYKWHALMVDSYTKHIQVVPLKKKDEAYQAVNKWIAEKGAPKQLKPDSENVLIKGKIKDIADRHGFHICPTTPYSPQQNLSETFNKTIARKAKTMIASADPVINNDYWPEAIVYAAHIHNNTPKEINNEFLTPNQRWGTGKYDAMTLIPFGSRVYIKPQPLDIRRTDKSLQEAIYVGYTENGHLVLDVHSGTNTQFQARQVVTQKMYNDHFQKRKHTQHWQVPGPTTVTPSVIQTSKYKYVNPNRTQQQTKYKFVDETVSNQMQMHKTVTPDTPYDMHDKSKVIAEERMLDTHTLGYINELLGETHIVQNKQSHKLKRAFHPKNQKTHNIHEITHGFQITEEDLNKEIESQYKAEGTRIEIAPETQEALRARGLELEAEQEWFNKATLDIDIDKLDEYLAEDSSHNVVGHIEDTQEDPINKVLQSKQLPEEIKDQIIGAIITKEGHTRTLQQRVDDINKGLENVCTPKVALASKYGSLVQDAMQKEREAFETLQLYDTVPIKQVPKEAVKLKMFWIIEVKKCPNTGQFIRLKARAVVDGSKQPDDIVTYAPCVDTSRLRIIAAMAAAKGYHTGQLDISNAYPNASHNDNYYIYPPPSIGAMKSQIKTMWRLKKNIYGLRQGAREFYKYLDKLMHILGFMRSIHDEAIYIGKDNYWPQQIIVCWHVDDARIFAKRKQDMETFREHLQSQGLKIKEVSQNAHAGLDILRANDGSIGIFQTQYTQKIVSKFDEKQGTNSRWTHPPNTPATNQVKDPPPQNSDEAEYMKDKPYRQATGALLWKVINTAPQLSFHSHYFSRFNANPSEEAYEGVIKTIQYLGKEYRKKKGQEKGIVYRRQEDGQIRITASADSSWNDCRITSRSTYGYCIMLNGSPVIWTTKRSPTHMRSSAHAEYHALTKCTEDIMMTKNFLGELGYSVQSPVPVQQDNTACVAIALRPSASATDRHHAVGHHYVRKMLSGKHICLVQTKSEDMLADGFTKFLQKSKFNTFESRLKLCTRGSMEWLNMESI